VAARIDAMIVWWFFMLTHLVFDHSSVRSQVENELLFT